MATWVLTDESCNINYKQNGVSYRTLPKELTVLEIVLAGEPLNNTGVNCLFVRYEGKYAIELPINDTTIGATSYATVELLRVAVLALLNSNPCASGGGGGVGTLQQVTTAGNTTDQAILVDAGGATNVTIAPDTGVVVQVVAGGNTQLLGTGLATGNAGGASSSILNDGTASFTDGGANTISLGATTGVRVIAGAVGTPSYSFTGQTDMGLYKISATQLGISVAGVLQAVISSAIGGIQTNSIGEQTNSQGITIVGSAGVLVLMQDIANDAYIKIPDSTADSACINLGIGGVDPTVPNIGDIWYDNVDGGFSFQGGGSLDHVTLLGDSGWALHTGTGAKTAFDADWTEVISAVPTQADVESVKNQVIAVQKALAAIQDHLMTNMDLLQA